MAFLARHHFRHGAAFVRRYAGFADAADQTKANGRGRLISTVRFGHRSGFQRGKSHRQNLSKACSNRIIRISKSWSLTTARTTARARLVEETFAGRIRKFSFSRLTTAAKRTRSISDSKKRTGEIIIGLDADTIFTPATICELAQTTLPTRRSARSPATPRSEIA